MNGLGSIILLFPALFYFFVLIFQKKSLKWYYVLHTFCVMLIIAKLLFTKWGDWFTIQNHFNTTGLIGVAVMTTLFVLILTQQNRKSYSEILKKEIWGEWEKYNGK